MRCPFLPPCGRHHVELRRILDDSSIYGRKFFKNPAIFIWIRDDLQGVNFVQKNLNCGRAASRSPKIRGFRRMRQLFLPACVSLMALIAADSKIAPRDFTIVPKAIGKIVARVPFGESTSGRRSPQGDSSISVPEKFARADLHLKSSGEVEWHSRATRSGDIDVPPQNNLLDDKALLALIPPPPDPAPVIVKPVKYRSRREVCNTLTKAAEKNDLPVPFFIRLLFQESRFKPDVVSRAGAEGIAQFMPDTSESVGLDNPFDPLQAIPASARLLRDLFQQFGNLGLAAAAYNAGPKRIQEWLAKKAKLPEETKGYVQTITGKPVETWTVATAGVPAIKLPPRAPCQDAAGLLAWDGPDTIPTPPPSPRMLAQIAAREKREAEANSKSARHGRHKIEADKSDAAKSKSSDKSDKSKVAADQLAARRQTSAKHARTHKRTHEDVATN